MAETATSLASLALHDARDALSRCATVQTLLGAADAAAAEALIFFSDGDDHVEDPPTDQFVLLTCVPLPVDDDSADLKHYTYTITAEFAIEASTEDDPQEDYIRAHNLDQAVTELWVQNEDGSMLFELESAGTAEAVREEDMGGAQAGVMLNLIIMTLGAWND